MKLVNVDISNFLAISNANVSLADRGLVGVQGETDETSADSNGAGKSSIFDAISWCLYGVTARGEDGDAVVNRTAGKGTVVTVTIAEGDLMYVVARYRKHPTGKNSLKVVQYKDGKDETDLTKGTTALTQKVVEQILGCTHEVFTGAVYSGQEKMPDLPSMTDKQLKVLIEEASGATLLEAAYQEANKRLNNKQKDLSAANMALNTAVLSVAHKTENLEAMKVRRKEFEENRLVAIRELHSDAKDCKLQIVTLETSLVSKGDKTIVANRIKALDANIAGAAAEKVEEREYVVAVEKAKRGLEQAVTDLAVFDNTLKTSNAKFKSLDHKVGCPCSTCARPFTEADILPAKKLAMDEISKANHALIEARAKKDAASECVKSATDALEAFRATMTDLSATYALRASLQEQMAEIEKTELKISSYKKTLASLVGQIKTRRDEANPIDAEIERLTDALSKAETDLIEAKAHYYEVEKAIQVATTVAKVFSPTGVRAFLLDEVTPFLNDQTAKYLGTLTDGHITATWTTLVKTAKGELREKFSIEVTSASAGETFKSISGGEKRKVRIACALALQDLVGRRASKPIELFIGDEIDDALDNAGRERLMTILEEKARDRGSVFVISHSDLKDWIRNTITVKKVDGKSTVEEALS
jgi:DNA repair exonuclease SbcCD ATPase subunit